VSVRDGSVPVESSHSSRRNSTDDGSDDYHDAASLSDDAYRGLLEYPDTVESNPDFFEEGLASTSNGDILGDSVGAGDVAFPFDSMVDLNAGQLDDIDQFVNFDHVFGNDSHDHKYDFLATDFSHQTAATSSGLQPILGAPSYGCDL